MSINIEAVARHWQLSPPEVEVLAMILAGQGNNAIARNIGRSVKTVEAHITKILRKAQCSNRLMLVVRASTVSSQNGDAVASLPSEQARPSETRLSLASGTTEAVSLDARSGGQDQAYEHPRDDIWARPEEALSETRVQAISPTEADEKSMLETG